jgi:hypothetical protein
MMMMRWVVRMLARRPHVWVMLVLWWCLVHRRGAMGVVTLLLLLKLLQLELLPLQLLKLLVNELILLRRIHARHHGLHTRHSERHWHTKGHGGHRSRHELLLSILEFGRTVAAHS